MSRVSSLAVVGRTRSTTLTEAEYRIMNVLWDASEATVGDVVGRLDGPSRPAYNSVLTILRILERKGYVRHEKRGRAFAYAPVVDRSQARRGALTQLLSRFFDNSRALLVMDLLGNEEVSGEEIERVKALLAAAPDTARKASPAPLRQLGKRR
jgi:predicted transcriptional regulator